MAPKTIKALIKDALANLKKEKLAEFVEELLDRKEEPRVRRNAVDGESYLVVTNVLVSTFTESKAPEVVAELLREIRCNDEADTLDEHFVDTHEVELISRVTNVNPILDELYAKKVIGDEKFAEISAQATPHAKIRMLCHSLKSRGSKDIFYELLIKHENFLMKDLIK
ncbi:hypothetical protein INR49_024651 [Caranx melampygus]|nr:hypothetical protein INR49_024651 [Caranx melampygus]